MSIEQKDKNYAALVVLGSIGVDVLDAALVAKAAIEAGRGRISQTLKCVSAGAEALRNQEKTVTDEKAVVAALAARKTRSVRTVYEIFAILRNGS